ncbi:hypothetical protein XU06_30125 (plasmid) [Rhodococcus erythropolis]|nr:hypothetical protein XU06_30125 [Rhodococcus erythropolis]
MTTVRDQLDRCQFLLNRARLAEDDNAIRRLSERRDMLVKQLAQHESPPPRCVGAVAGLALLRLGYLAAFHLRKPRAPTSCLRSGLVVVRAEHTAQRPTIRAEIHSPHSGSCMSTVRLGEKQMQVLTRFLQVGDQNPSLSRDGRYSSPQGKSSPTQEVDVSRR